MATIDTSVIGPIVLSGTINPLTISSTGTVMSTAAGADGIDGAAGTAWSVINAGTISSSTGFAVSLAGTGTISSTGGLVTGKDGVVLRGGGTVANTGSIAATGAAGTGGASGAGIFIAGGLGTVTNGGGITAAAYGVELDAGGLVTNTGTITGGHNAIRVLTATGTVTNAGSIADTGSDVIGLFAGGSVSNAAGGSIVSHAAAGAAIYITGAAGTVTNTGSISGIDYAVDLGKGGSVTNNAGGNISGHRGVNIQGGAGVVSNSGIISGTTAFGVRLASGGQVTNAAGASISGPVGVQVYGAGGTVTNNGTISGTSKAVVFTGTGANRLVAGSASVFIGSIAGSTAAGSSNTLELAGGTGTLSGLTGGAGTVTENAHSWSFSNFGTIAVDAGADWTLSGNNTIATILDNGTIDLGGALTVSTAIDAASTGVFQLDGHALEVAAAVGPGSQISFLGASRLTIDSAASFGTSVGAAAYTGPLLENFAADDTIDLKSFSATGVLLNYNTANGLLQLSNSASQVASLVFQTSSLGGGVFKAVADGSNGILITSANAAVTEKLLSDTGTLATDNVTSNAALTGTADPNATVTLTQGAVTLGTTTASATGAWTFTPAGLSQGVNIVMASAISGSASLTFTYDTVAPAVTEQLVSDTGTAGDNITSDPTLTGSGDPNAVVTLTEGTTVLGSTTANSSGTWSFIPPSLPPGAHTIVSSETDLAGNSTSASLTFTFNPVVPVATERLVQDTGTSASDNVTSNSALTGTADPNATVTLTQGAVTLGTTTASATGTWTFNPTGLSQGINTIVASEINGSAALTFTYDTAAPGVTEALLSDTGTSSADKITNVDALTGSGDPNAVVTLTEGATVLGNATANAAGVWNFTPSALAQGAHTIVASETDLAGNTGSTSLTFTYDSVGPTVTEALASDTGTSTIDNVTAINGLTGLADANAVVTLRQGATVLGTTTASVAGIWNFTPSALAQGVSTVVASETDAAGNTGSASLTFTFDTIVPSVTERLANDTGTPGDNITADPTLTGSGDPNAVVTLKEGSTTLGTATANASGVWTFLPSMGQGTHTVVASETDVAGNTGSASLTFTLAGTIASGGTISTSVTGPFVLSAATNPLTITNTGIVTSTATGADAIDGGSGTNWTVTNNGTLISSSGFGVLLSGSGSINSSGLVTGKGALTIRGGGSVSNSGSIAATGAVGGGSSIGSGIFITGATGTVTNSGTITGGAYGVALDAGGLVTNTNMIIGGEDGVRIIGGIGTVTNSGSIFSTVDDGIGFFGGGSVANAVGAAIGNKGTKGAGIYITGGAGTVTNAGSITGVVYAIDLGKGGSVTNAAGGLISSQKGVEIQGGSGVVSNSGNIAGTSSFGVRLASGGQVTNAAGGSITGPVGVQIYSAAGTVTNNGTISGTTKAVVFTGTGANRLVAGPTAVFIGSVAGSTAAGSTNTLELAGGTGTLSGLTGGAGKVTENAHSWSFSNFGTIAVDAGADWTLSGSNTVATILDNGTIHLGGSLTVSSAINAASTGVFQLDGNALEVAAAVGSGSQISFLGSSRLTVDTTAAFGTGVGTATYTGPMLENFTADDKVDLKTFGQTGVLLNYNAATGLLQISNNANQVASLAFQTSSLGGGGFLAVSDVLTGIFITRV